MLCFGTVQKIFVSRFLTEMEAQTTTYPINSTVSVSSLLPSLFDDADLSSEFDSWFTNGKLSCYCILKYA